MKAATWVQDSFRALSRYLLVLTAVSALALLARAAVPSFPQMPATARTVAVAHDAVLGDAATTEATSAQAAPILLPVPVAAPFRVAEDRRLPPALAGANGSAPAREPGS
ncbi:hypothetical protein [Pseudomonas sp. CGJS7]|uniref:hypothetical protein n=1 Tax=Pseudomonas sp. CGJS7 TaxID=3109348 RepID=UPI0030096FD3